MSEPAALLNARSICKRFGDFTANDAVSLTIAPGSIHALLGENGAGKSTFVKMLYGVMQPDEGEFIWQGDACRIISPKLPGPWVSPWCSSIFHCSGTDRG